MPLPGNGILLFIALESAGSEKLASSITCLGFTPTTKKPSSPRYHGEADFCILDTSCNLNKTQTD